MRAHTLLGLDLSVRAAAAVSVPLDFDGDFARVHSMVVGAALKRSATDAERVARAESIARSIVAFALRQGATEAWFESPAYSRNTSMHTLGALYGVVALELVRAGVSIHTAPMASARKLLLGKVPRKDVKVAVYQALRAAGARFETMDESDAYCAANWACSERGGYTLAMAAA